ncbi:MAG TPA: four helix bundle protein [Bacteroidales bacterium]|nr:four helix bundle protein [Bacteroidales bacterium]HPT01748.1 four helix bundle protein [Bacteroidales bacterium]
MDNKEFGKLLEERSRNFSTAIMRLSFSLPDTDEGRVVRNRIAESGTNVGDNCLEILRSGSESDFRNKISWYESLAGETEYWLEIIEAMNWIESCDLQSVRLELAEMLKIFTLIRKNIKN